MSAIDHPELVVTSLQRSLAFPALVVAVRRLDPRLEPREQERR